ncbi:MAG TPA: ABC transporter ATP-binding protein [Acidimicrobiia bacterium]|nr:ABC transporter ATP-binding protein [Acidimicrobiia bacterium]
MTPDAPENLRASLAAGLRLVAMYVGRHPVAFTLAVVGAAAFAAAIVASAVVIGNATDSVIVPVLDGREEIGGRLLPAVAAIVAVAVWKAVAITLRRTAAGYLQYANLIDVRRELIDRMLRLEMRWYRRQSIGDLLAVTDADASQATFILAPVPYGTGASLLLIGSVVMILTIDPVLAAVTFISLAGIMSIDIRGSWTTFGLYQRVQDQRAKVSRVAHESFDGALTVKALGREDHETQRFRGASDALADTLANEGRVHANYRVVVEGLLSVVTVLILVVGALRIRTGDVTAGDVITIAYLLSLLYIPIRIIGFVLWDMSHAVAGWNRVQRVLDADELVPYGDVQPRRLASGAEVHGMGMTFSYTHGEVVLSDVALSIPAGRIVAVVGPTAAGKSTLVTLMARLWDPTAGRITLDGTDLRDFARSALPGEVAFVAQEAFLFDDTVRGNIAFGTDATDEEVWEAARLANAAEFIDRLPQGLDTDLGERGTTLSGGQRQRVALARALVRKPRLLILDDATSAVDASVETRILEGLRDAELPSTVIVVAYRRSSITLADEVVFVDEGRIVAHGPHERLMATTPGYARILEAYEDDAAERRDEGR